MSRVLMLHPRKPLAELATEINAEHEAAEKAINESLGHAKRCGDLLIEAKSQLTHGAFGKWLGENFPGSERTAQAYMRVARRWEDLPNPQTSADLSIVGALNMLAEPRESEPEPSPPPATTNIPISTTSVPRAPERRHLNVTLVEGETPSVTGSEEKRRARERPCDAFIP